MPSIQNSQCQPKAASKPPAAGKFPDEPGVHRAAQEVAGFRGLTRAGHVVEQPLDFGGGEIGVHHEAGFAADDIFVPLAAQLFATARGAAALPDDGMGDWFAGAAVPDHYGFALIGDGDGGDLFRRGFGAREDVVHGGKLRVPDGVWVVFDPAGLWIELRKLLLGAGAGIQRAVKQDGARTGRALVQGQDERLVFHGISRN